MNELQTLQDESRAISPLAKVPMTQALKLQECETKIDEILKRWQPLKQKPEVNSQTEQLFATALSHQSQNVQHHKFVLRSNQKIVVKQVLLMRMLKLCSTNAHKNPSLDLSSLYPFLANWTEELSVVLVQTTKLYVPCDTISAMVTLWFSIDMCTTQELEKTMQLYQDRMLHKQ